MGPKPPEHGDARAQKTQEKARLFNTTAYLEKSAGWRFESFRDKNFLTFLTIGLGSGRKTPSAVET